MTTSSSTTSSSITPSSTTSFSTAQSHSPISQEVLHLKEYDLAAEINQFSAFQDDWKSDFSNTDLVDDNKFNSQPDNEDSYLFNENARDSADKSDCDLDLDVNCENADDLDNNINVKTEVFFALLSLIYSASFSKNEVLKKLNLFKKDHDFALVIWTSNSKQSTWYFMCNQNEEYQDYVKKD